MSWIYNCLTKKEVFSVEIATRTEMQLYSLCFELSFKVYIQHMAHIQFQESTDDVRPRRTWLTSRSNEKYLLPSKDKVDRERSLSEKVRCNKELEQRRENENGRAVENKTCNSLFPKVHMPCVLLFIFPRFSFCFSFGFADPDPELTPFVFQNCYSYLLLSLICIRQWNYSVIHVKR